MWFSWINGLARFFLSVMSNRGDGPLVVFLSTTRRIGCPIHRGFIAMGWVRFHPQIQRREPRSEYCILAMRPPTTALGKLASE